MSNSTVQILARVLRVLLIFALLLNVSSSNPNASFNCR